MKHNHQDHHAHMVLDFRKRFWISSVASIPVLTFSPMIQKFLNIENLSFNGDQIVIFILATFIFFYGGYPFITGAWNELKNKNPGMMTLVAVAITTAYVYSAAVLFGLEGKQLLWELVTLVDVMLLGHWIEMKSVMGASRALEELVKSMPKIAHKINPDGSSSDVGVDNLIVGDRVLVKPGEKISVDGAVVEGTTSVNESMLTGETRLVEKTLGAEVVGGSINGDGSITIEIKKMGKDTYLSQIVELVRVSQESKSRTQNLAGRAAFWLTIIALSGGIITLFSWLLFTTQGFGFALERTIAVIVIACPHALGLAIPLVVAFSTSLSARNGLLIRNRDAFENSRKIDAVIFDKTGTLTRGEFVVSDVITLSKDVDESEILTLAGAIEAHSEHPIAGAILKKAGKVFGVENFKAIPGKGAEGKVDGQSIKVVSPGYLRETNMNINDPRIKKVMDEGKTVVFVIVNNILVGSIGLDDDIREEAKEAILDLQNMGIKTIMLTGDSKAVAKRVAKKLKIDEYFAEVLPSEKFEKVKEVQSRGFIVAMVGDGVNDAPALAEANVGIAIGAGTDVAIETADIVLVKSNPLDVVKIIGLARKTYDKMVQNLWWATGYNIVALPLAAGVAYSAGVVLSPAVGAIFMSLSTIVVAFNASLLKLKS
jgi:P-type Cu2+ transporter